MTPIIPHRKEKPLTSLVGMGGGAAGMANAGGAAEKVYIDEVYNQTIYRGNSSTQDIVTGIDMADKGGMLIIKCTDNSRDWCIGSTGGTMGATGSAGNWLRSNGPNQKDYSSSRILNYNNNGFRIGGSQQTGGNSDAYTSFSFAKQKGFFDVQYYTGTGGASQNISHDLDAIPGMIWTKQVDGSQDWQVYHRGYNNNHTPEQYKCSLNSDNAISAAQSAWANTPPTSTQFTVQNDWTNESGKNYVAYIFGGGPSTDAKNVSVGAPQPESGGSNNGYIRIPSHADLTLDGDFTMEMWVKKSGSNYDYLWTQGDSNTPGGFQLYFSGTDLRWYGGTGASSNSNKNIVSDIKDHAWHHVAASRTGSTINFFLDGRWVNDVTSSATFSGDITTGENYGTGSGGAGTPSRSATNISNFRIIKGQNIYPGVGNIKVPTKPLELTTGGATASNVSLLCFQSSTVTAATKSPVTIQSDTTRGTVTATAAAGPFDGGAIFGEESDQNIIKCGWYTGNSANNYSQTIPIGWEPQFYLVKNVDGNNWRVYNNSDNFGTYLNGSNSWTSSGSLTDSFNLEMDNDQANPGPGTRVAQIGNGIRYIAESQPEVNDNNAAYIYMAVRSPVGTVVKTPEAGTECFAVDVGDGSTTWSNGACWDSGFPVEFAYHRAYNSTDNWVMANRKAGEKYWYSNLTNAPQGSSNYKWNWSDGWGLGNQSSQISWMWRQSRGFDCQMYIGNGTLGNSFQHNLGVPPELIWIKNISRNDWNAFGSAYTRQSNPWNNVMYFNNNSNGNDGQGYFNYTAPTAHTVTLGNNEAMNWGSNTFVAALWASVEGISKIGVFDGNGSSGQTITTGFQPRYLLIKRVDGTGDYAMWDSYRGLGDSGSQIDPWLTYNESTAQNQNYDMLNVSSTGFILKNDTYNTTGERYMYHAHA